MNPHPGVFEGSEEALQVMLEQWLRGLEMPIHSQAELQDGSRPDLLLCYSQATPEPWCVVELKTGLSPKKSSVSDLADYFEQCVKYHFKTGLPVFLGPFFIPTMGVAHYMSGGAEPKCATAAFSAMAGRMNVGMLFIHAEPGFEHKTDYWYGFRMTLRQQTVAQWSKNNDRCKEAWPTPNEPIALVDFSGAASKSVRG